MYTLLPPVDRAPAPQTILTEEPVAPVPLTFQDLLETFTPLVIVTWVLLAANVFVFVAMLLTGFNPDHANNQVLLNWGANFGPATVSRGEWWRLVTCMFVHLGFVHIAMNMYVLFQIGPFMERLLGNVGFAVVYFICGIAAAITSVAWNPYVISAGASGAIFGLYGALIGFLCLRKDSVPAAQLAGLLKGAVVFVGYNAVFGVLHSGTDIAAHAGGLLAGVVCGLAISNPITVGYSRRRLLRSLALGLAAVAVVPIAASRLPHPIDLVTKIQHCSQVIVNLTHTWEAIFRDARAQKASDNQVADRIESEVLRPWMAEEADWSKIQGLPGKQQQLVDVYDDFLRADAQATTKLIAGLRAHSAARVRQAADERNEGEREFSEKMKEFK